MLRRFFTSDLKIKLYLFKQYCLQFYGAELWFGCTRTLQPLRQFAVGYHKAVKKLLNLSSHESNHFACQEANLLLFEHFVNKIKINATYRVLLKPCEYIRKNIDFFRISSRMIYDVNNILSQTYQIDSILENDIDAVMSRIQYVQNHEPQLRQSW